jgi:predicted dehydrogenase
MTYSAGIIGTGGVAGMGILGIQDSEEIGNKKVYSSHAGGYLSSDEIRLVAVADINKNKLDTFADVWDIPEERRYLDHEAMLLNEDLDVVSVCTPTYLHARHVIDAAQSAADPSAIWCEKPLSSSVSSGEQMINVCDETDTHLVVNHTSRFIDSVNELRRLIQEERILGDVQSVVGLFRMELMRNSTHLLDTIVYLLDARPERLSGYITGENEAVDALDAEQEVDDAGGGGTAVMDDGTFVMIDCTVERDISTMCYHMIGTEAKLYFNVADEECRYWRIEDGSHRLDSLPSVEFREDDYTQAFSKVTNHLVDLIEGRADNRSSGREALRSLEMIAGFYISHYTESQLKAPFDRPLKDVSITSW